MKNRLLSYKYLIFPGSKKIDEMNTRLSDLGFQYVSKKKLFYVYDYYSKSRFEDIHKKDPNTRKLLKLKNKDPEAILEYSKKIAEFISNAVEDGTDYTIMCVPSADKDNKSCMELCIETIKNNPDMISNKSIHMLEGEYCLYRRKSVVKARELGMTERIDVIKRLVSLGCKLQDKKALNKSTLILIDDIATTGASLFACILYLGIVGVRTASIKKLTMGYTVLNNTVK